MKDKSTFTGRVEELELLAKEFQFDSLPENFKDNWEAAVKTYPEAIPFFLEDDFIDYIMEEFSFISEFTDMFKEGAEVARRDKRVSHIAWLWYHMCYVSGDWNNIYSWPNMNSIIGIHGNMIPILVLFAGYENMLDFYKERNIPEEIIAANYHGIQISFNWFKKMYEKPGVGNNVLAWAVRYFTGVLFYIGRLQYEFRDFGNKIFVYRNRNTGEAICLLEDGQVFRGDGQYNGTNGIIDEKGAWTSKFREFNGLIQGNAAAPKSYAIDKPVTLKADEWELVLKRDDPVLSIHIPAEGRLDYDALKESFLRTEPFFSTYFPDYNWQALVCNTWLLDTKLRDFLRDDSNIVKFQDSFYLYPLYSPNNTGVYRFLFGTDEQDPEKLEAKSSLQRNVRDYLMDGGKIKLGGGFLLRQDLDKPRGYYQDRWNNTLVEIL